MIAHKILGLALVALSAGVSAQEFSAEMFRDPDLMLRPPTVEVLQDLSRDMLSSYRAEGVAGMQKIESYCWDEAEKDGFRLVAMCASITRIGTVIETHYARDEEREPNPLYSAPVAPARMVAKTRARLSEDKLAHLIKWNDDPETQRKIVDSLYAVGLN